MPLNSVDHARKLAVEAVREADRASAEALSIGLEGFGGPATPFDIEMERGQYGTPRKRLEVAIDQAIAARGGKTISLRRHRRIK
jgi:hypothetical protein